jgi:hypothetical protein
MLKEAHTISYIQQASHEWIEGDEKETFMPKLLKASGWFLLTFNMDQRFYRGSKQPMSQVKTLFSFENMESHGESIKSIFCQLITWTPPKEGIHYKTF